MPDDAGGAFRGFVALPLPPEMREQAAAVVERLRAAGEVRWTAAENLHLTLKFLGHVPHSLVPELAARLGEVARAAAPFEFEVGGLGAFPRVERPQVVWVGVTAGEAALARLAADVEAACAGVGFAPEGRPFRAHITLGRARAGRGAEGGRGLARALQAAGPVALGRARADRFHLMKSELTPRGSLYTVMATFELGKSL